MLKPTLIAAALLAASSASAQTLEEAAIALYDPITTNHWEYSDGAFRRQRNKDNPKATSADWWTLSIKNCVITWTRHETYPANPDYNYAWIHTLDLNKVIGFAGAERSEYTAGDGRREYWTKLNAAGGAFCSSDTVKNGVSTKIPAKTTECFPNDPLRFGFGGYAPLGSDPSVKAQKALAYIRQNFCKGREF